jgi:hypothetical protein
VEESVSNPARVRIHIEHFVGAKSRKWTRGDISDGVVACFSRRQAFVCEQMEEIRHPPKWHEVILNILPGSEMALAAAKLVRHTGKLHHLAGRQHTAGHFRPHHLDARLSLTINASPEPNRPELVIGQLAVEILKGPGAKQLNVLANDLVVLGA